MDEYRLTNEGTIQPIKVNSVESDLHKVVGEMVLDFDEKLREAYMAGYRKAREEMKAERESKW